MHALSLGIPKFTKIVGLVYATYTIIFCTDKIKLIGTGLYQDYEYCVSIPNYRPTYSTIATMARATQAADVMMAVAAATQDIDDNDTMVDTGSESAEISSTNTMELDSASFSSSSLSSSGTVIAIATASATTTAITTAVLSSGNSDAVTTSTNTPSAASQSVVIPFVRIREE